MCTILCYPHITVDYHFRISENIPMQTISMCTAACSVLPCICHSICTVGHACIVCIYITTTIVDAFPVQPSTRPLPPRSRYAKASRLLRCSLPAPQPTSAATGVAPQLRGMGGEKTSVMAEGAARMNRRGQELDEGLGSGSGGDGQAQPDDRCDGYGQRLGPPP